MDPGFFREMVINLLLAARDRMPTGGRLRLETERRGAWLWLTVQDSGPPYNEEELGRLFDPFKSKGPRPQSSLLLGVARTHVQRWGGELEMTNADGGAQFVLRLPIAEQALAVPPEANHAEPSAATSGPRRLQQTRRVLVVDDDPDNARMLAEVLADEGYQTSVAHSAQDARALWNKCRFDAALLDVMMPDVSGWELARELRQHSPEVLLAVVTGADVRGQNRNNLALVDAVFRKPIDVGALDEFLSQGEGPHDFPPDPSSAPAQRH
jgi:two-component system, cell cycle sensor histidine kinase and response regulator CckA